jgi:hypothetical protein
MGYTRELPEAMTMAVGPPAAPGKEKVGAVEQCIDALQRQLNRVGEAVTSLGGGGLPAMRPPEPTAEEGVNAMLPGSSPLAVTLQELIRQAQGIERNAWGYLERLEL